jgi:hypothetical protein
MEPGYLIGAGLLGRINETIERVAGQPYGGQTTSVTPRLEGGQPGSSKNFRVCTFTGAWSIGSTKAVTFRGVTTTPNTVSATNLFYPAAPAGDCGIAKDGTAWFLVSVTMTQASVITNVSLGTAGLEFTRAIVVVAGTSTQSSVTIGTTACA